MRRLGNRLVLALLPWAVSRSPKNPEDLAVYPVVNRRCGKHMWKYVVEPWKADGGSYRKMPVTQKNMQPQELPTSHVEVAASNEVQLQSLRRLREVSVEHHEAPGMAPRDLLEVATVGWWD